MRYINLFLCVLLLLFVVAQYNDPDAPLWMMIYAVPTVWTGIVTFRPDLLCRKTAMILLWVCLFAAALATMYYWPTMPYWWRWEIWWKQETAREGMGAMIVLAALLVVFLSMRWHNLRRI
jgi:hypothetical protein